MLKFYGPIWIRGTLEVFYFKGTPETMESWNGISVTICCFGGGKESVVSVVARSSSNSFWILD